MREVARLASVNPNGDVFKEKRPSLVDVAAQARLFVGKRLLDHTGTGSHPPGRRRCTVWIVAIRTRHNTFIHAMLRGHVELRANRAVALVAEVGLLLSEERFRGD